MCYGFKCFLFHREVSPEFALELMTRTKNLPNKVVEMSPTHSALSAYSSESSERGWSSDPENFRHRPSKTLNQVKEEWDHVETVTAGLFDFRYSILEVLMHRFIDGSNDYLVD